MKRPLHRLAHVNCEYGAANWSACDRARDNAYADWQAMQQVILAFNIATRGDTRPYRKEKGAFAQLVQYLAGEREDITNDDGNPSEAPWVMRLRAAIERVKAGQLPGYNLYEPAVPANTGG